MPGIIRIGTRESQLAVWQATRVSDLLTQQGHSTELVYIKSEGDTDLVTPLYEMGVQGIFTKSLDIALLQGRIDLAVHSMKDVPVVLPLGLVQTAVLKRGSYKDILVTPADRPIKDSLNSARIATSSIRRKAQWLNRYPGSQIENLRGNVNTRLKKLAESDWDGAIFAAAGLERIGLRPEHSADLDWMLPAPAQGAIMVVARMEDRRMMDACMRFNDETTAFCVKAERDFLKTLLGGCSAPISALAQRESDQLILRGNILSVDGVQKLEVEKKMPIERSYSLGVDAALEILDQGGDKIMEAIRKNEG
jgi:hydroxymethylbilane synthase